MKTAEVPERTSEQEAERVAAEFKRICDAEWPLWEKRIAGALETTKERGAARTRDQIETFLVNNAKQDLQRLEVEINLMLSRSGIIVAAATLLFAVFALQPSGGPFQVSKLFTLCALLCTSLAFAFAVAPLAPPLRRAWKEAYNQRTHQNSLVVDNFTSWVADCWLGDRRTPVITAYKKAHSVAARMLLVAAILAIPSLGLSSLGL